MVPSAWLLAGIACSLYVGYRVGYGLGRFRGAIQAACVFHALMFGPRPSDAPATDAKV